ncbi:MAG: HNH endonuclease [Burkholderiaceae bacterium]|nr:HNH endonuclease [Burkholderiaceae bacterium]
MNSEKFFAQLVQNGDCLDWGGALDTAGYGNIRINGKGARAHRFAYELAHGPIPAGEGYHGIVVMHSCDNRRCCNPDHLSLGTHAENMADMAAKGRSAPKAGRLNGRAVLTPQDVAAIRADPRGTRSIAKSYPVSRAAVQRIKSGVAWASV